MGGWWLLVVGWLVFCCDEEHGHEDDFRFAMIRRALTELPKSVTGLGTATGLCSELCRRRPEAFQSRGELRLVSWCCAADIFLILHRPGIEQTKASKWRFMSIMCTLCLFIKEMYVYTHMYTYIYIYTHTYTTTYTCTYTHTCMHACIHTHIRTYAYVHHTLTYIYTCGHTCIHSYIRTQTDRQTDTHTHTHMHI